MFRKRFYHSLYIVLGAILLVSCHRVTFLSGTTKNSAAPMFVLPIQQKAQEEQYLQDAYRVVLKTPSTPQNEQVQIAKLQSALIALYRSGIPETQLVMKTARIHAFPWLSLNYIQIEYDPSIGAWDSWQKNRKELLSSADLISSQPKSLIGELHWRQENNKYFVEVETFHYTNIIRLGQMIQQQIPGIKSLAYKFAEQQLGGDIQWKEDGDDAIVTFEYSWQRENEVLKKFWQFRVGRNIRLEKSWQVGNFSQKELFDQF